MDSERLRDIRLGKTLGFKDYSPPRPALQPLFETGGRLRRRLHVVLGLWFVESGRCALSPSFVMRFSHFSPAMPRSLFVAALVAVAPALSVHAQTARTDTAPVRAAAACSAAWRFDEASKHQWHQIETDEIE